ncbi:hypothetical protein ACJBPS_03005 [Streptococcus suis]|uniref:hypothetical protein n=1 Tax=Streptococcus suis TaxID=1307 RepID=UPI001F05A69E|nr:hypothetical protein [Streptococcus suis]MCH1644329.1 hypothetical protein [Streptococcus suis]MCL4928560.1 hypothetical protein [Streptococcus suis]HEM3069608.1 hypothetical protein [Streptococcus suis]HEM3081648.1 hypothetical protein [Streptococcus suis]HEM3085721.1 hypothetical protein [Streptococcus suis]
MNEIRPDREMTLSDLRKLGGQGNVTAYLLTGEIVTLRSDCGTTPKRAIVDGELKMVEEVILYRQIRTVQRDHILIARRERYNNQSILRLTGKGYHRPN